MTGSEPAGRPSMPETTSPPPDEDVLLPVGQEPAPLPEPTGWQPPEGSPPAPDGAAPQQEPAGEPRQPDAAAWQPPRPNPDRWRPVSALVCFVASLLAVIGAFLNLFVVEVRAGERTTVEITGWGATGVDERGSQAVPLPIADNGYLMVGAAVVLLAAAVAGVLAAAAPTSARIVRSSNVLATVAGSVLVASTASIAMQVLGWDNFFTNDLFTQFAEPDNLPATTIGIGFWLLLVAAALAIYAGVLTWLTGRAGRPLDPRVEPETPPLGIPAVVHRLPDEQPDQR